MRILDLAADIHTRVGFARYTYTFALALLGKFLKAASVS
jgi:hypothetical protein